MESIAFDQAVSEGCGCGAHMEEESPIVAGGSLDGDMVSNKGARGLTKAVGSM